MKEIQIHVFALLIFSIVSVSDFRQELEFAMPFIQATAFVAVFVNNAVQITRQFYKSKNR